MPSGKYLRYVALGDSQAVPAGWQAVAAELRWAATFLGPGSDADCAAAPPATAALQNCPSFCR
jgi:hypothetical protein